MIAKRKIISLVPILITPVPTRAVEGTTAETIAQDAENALHGRRKVNQGGGVAPIPSLVNKYVTSTNVAIAPLVGIGAHHFGLVTDGYNAELVAFQKMFRAIDKSTGVRGTGVSRAWGYEYAEVKMSGKGTGDFNSQQRQELLGSKSVRGTEGHHINNVVDHPELQADPNNVKMLNHKDHLEAHGGNYQNETSGPLLNRDDRLVRVNQSRVIRNELYGIGLAAAIGLGTGFTIGFVVGLAQNRLNPDCMKYAFISGAKAGVGSAVMATVSAVLGRTVGAVASDALAKSIIARFGENMAESMLENISGMCSMGIVGSLTIVVFSVVQFVQLKQMGFSTKESLLRVGKSAALSFPVLAISIAAQVVWGGPAGIVVSVVAGVVVTAHTVCTIRHNQEIAEKIVIYTISLCQPIWE